MWFWSHFVALLKSKLDVQQTHLRVKPDRDYGKFLPCLWDIRQRQVWRAVAGSGKRTSLQYCNIVKSFIVQAQVESLKETWKKLRVLKFKSLFSGMNCLFNWPAGVFHKTFQQLFCHYIFDDNSFFRKWACTKHS